MKHHFNGAIKEQIIMKNRAQMKKKLGFFEELKLDFDYHKNKDIDSGFNKEAFSLEKASQNFHKKFKNLFKEEDKLETKL